MNFKQSKRPKDLADIASMDEAHPHLWDMLTVESKQHVQFRDKE